MLFPASPPLPQENSPEAGVTLVEVLVVIGILSILAVVSGTWLFRHADRADLKRATRNLVSSLHAARIEAIKQNRPMEVRITDTEWSVVRQADNATLRKFSLAGFRTPIDINTNSKNTYVFTGKGRPIAVDGTLPNGSINMTSPGSRMSISVDISGNIRVQ